ncbi:hypothetical protein L5515_009542 [Caenorhabditis briggsae]|nr:hypothetical protein L5515_009542 [Caenorhabditis briggsae]
MVGMEYTNNNENDGLEVLNKWEKMSESQIADRVKIYKATKGMNRTLDDKYFSTGCQQYFDTADYDYGNTTTAGYKFCCEMLNYCKWYNQTWFHITMGAVALIIIISCIIGSCCWLCGGRGRVGKDSKKMESSEENDD